MDSQRLDNLRALAAELRSATSLEALLTLFLDAAVEVAWAERGFLVRINTGEQGPHFDLEYARGFDRESLQTGSGVSRTVVARVHRRGRGLVTTSEEDQDLLGLSSVRDRRVLSILCVPIYQGEVLRRVLYLDHRFRTNSFSDADLARLDRLAEYAGRAFQRAEEGGQVQERAKALAEQVLAVGADPTQARGGQPKRIILVDNQVAAREGLARCLEDQVDLTVCAQASNAAETLEAVKTSAPDLVLLDLLASEGAGLDLLKDLAIRHPDLPCLVFTQADPQAFAERCLRAGARGFVSKQSSTAHVLAAIHKVLEGQIALDESLAGQVLASLSTQELSPIARLSDRELQVFQLIGQGKGTRQVAESLHLSVKTIESHNANIKKKLGLTSASELQREATRWSSMV